MKSAALLSLFLVVTPLPLAANEPFKPEEAAKHVGKEVTIAGKVGSVAENKGAIYINLGKPYPNQDFTAYVSPENAPKLKDKLPKLAEGDVISVTGKVTLHRDKPQIEVTEASQVKKQDEKRTE